MTFQLLGMKQSTVNTLRLWNAEPVPFPQNCKDILKYKRETEAVSEFLYPDDTHDEGKILTFETTIFPCISKFAKYCSYA